jgi:uncharacterized lipoprotein YmbA
MRPLAVMIALLSLAGCAGTPPSRYYLMDAGPPPAGAPVIGPVIFVDAATVAAYADRSAMVVRRGATEVAFADFDVWAEPVAGQITAVLAGQRPADAAASRPRAGVPGRGRGAALRDRP